MLPAGTECLCTVRDGERNPQNGGCNILCLHDCPCPCREQESNAQLCSAEEKTNDEEDHAEVAERRMMLLEVLQEEERAEEHWEKEQVDIDIAQYGRRDVSVVSEAERLFPCVEPGYVPKGAVVGFSASG